MAAANKAVKCAEVIIPLLSSVNVSDRGGRTALHHAALNGHVEVGIFIIQNWNAPSRHFQPQVETDLLAEILKNVMKTFVHQTFSIYIILNFRATMN